MILARLSRVLLMVEKVISVSRENVNLRLVISLQENAPVPVIHQRKA